MAVAGKAQAVEFVATAPAAPVAGNSCPDVWGCKCRCSLPLLLAFARGVRVMVALTGLAALSVAAVGEVLPFVGSGLSVGMEPPAAEQIVG